MNRSLVALAIGTFALGIAEFSMMGILGDVASSLKVDIVKAGHLISAYSAGVAVGAPLLIFFRRLPLKRLMLILSLMIAVGSGMAALAPSYEVLFVARFISGLPHGAFFGAGAIVSSKLVDGSHGASAVAVMVGGMTLANLVGVPGATLVSNVLSWRMAFALVAFFGMLAYASIRHTLPYLSPLPDTGLKGQFRFLKSAAPWLIYAGVFFGQMSIYTWFSYVQPVMTKVTGFSQDAMTWIMVVAGAGMVTGNILAGRLADRYRASIVTAVTALLAVPVLVGIYYSAPYRLPSAVLTFVATAILFGIGGPLQYLIVRFAKGGEMLGGAGIQIAFNVSNALAAVVGGAAINHFHSLASVALVGIPCALTGATALFILSYRYRSEGA